MSFIYKNIELGQSENILNVFTDEIPQYDLIIEIGTHRGGLTLLLSDMLTHGKIVSYELHKSNCLICNTDKIDIRFVNCFNAEDEIKNLIESHKKVLLLCDGGKKELEFKTFAKYLKKDDVIMLHDYSDNINSYKEYAKLINWPTHPESHYKNITSTINTYKLTKYKYNEFLSVFWGAFIKT